MDRYTLPKIQAEYFAQAQPELQPPYTSRPYARLSYSSTPFAQGAGDSSFLEQLLAQEEIGHGSLADQVFGRQARHESLSLHLLINLLYQRSFLHEKHLRDIQHRHTECQDKLSVLRMLFPVADSRLRTSMESLVVQLEREKREEELTFWKDTASLRKELLEKAGEYKAARDRWLHLGSLEVNYG